MRILFWKFMNLSSVLKPDNNTVQALQSECIGMTIYSLWSEGFREAVVGCTVVVAVKALTNKHIKFQILKTILGITRTTWLNVQLRFILVLFENKILVGLVA